MRERWPMKRTIRECATQLEGDPICDKAIRRDFKIRVAVSIFSVALGVAGVFSHIA
jgi:hypothetical protein